MENETIRIILANDHSLLSKGISEALNKSVQDIQIVAQVSDFKELLSLLNRVQADILVTDDVMPGGTILSILPVIKKQCPDLKIIVTSMYESFNPITIEVTKLVERWISYTADGEEFRKTIEAVYVGNCSFDSNN